MKDIVVHIKVSRYVKMWLEATLGNPVRFPAHSYENALLHHYLRRRPSGEVPEGASADAVAVVIPDCSVRRPEFYNYLGRRGQGVMREAIDHLFRMHLWSDCRRYVGTKQLERSLDDWCRRYGIGVDSREAVRKKFYRMRQVYARHGIILGKKYTKRLP